MAERCQHFMLQGKCAISICPHYDGGRPRQKLKTDFVRCSLEACNKPYRREEMTWTNGRPICKDCLYCKAECGNLRRIGSRYCQVCFDKMAQPKKCQGCDTILKSGKGELAFLKHVKRTRCAKCSRRLTTSVWY